MTKKIENIAKTNRRLEFFSEHDPYIDIDDLSCHCISPKKIKSHGVFRVVSCMDCLGCQNRLKKYKASNMIMEFFSFGEPLTVNATLCAVSSSMSDQTGKHSMPSAILSVCLKSPCRFPLNLLCWAGKYSLVSIPSTASACFS